ncbi:hypothetical protein H5J22_11505 [Cetobacterium sp. 8H]|uniref:hypothetical protein n=1 Tax=Cetobacterium sp. 8H TaxID=2759681 RepID=UPI00163BD3BF|nr:hypothetical protein [Cetobacterium sp. 8H]MBC2852023.1 hypothetical protein [Cetobacterium sp. 8H]
MSKRLKSFHKLFFIVIFSILFSRVIGSNNSLDLPEKIARELEQIDALPRRTKPAELNIEVTKIKSEPLEEVYIDRKNKNIYVDFSKKREQALKGIRNAEDLEKKYNLIVSENVQGSSEVNGRSKGRNKSASQIMNYEVVEYKGKKVLKIPYENEPEKLYISIQENNQVIKVYNANIERAFLANEKAIIETKTVIINLKNGVETYTNKTLAFNLGGDLINSEIPQNEVGIIKEDGFINSFSGETEIKISYINASGNAISSNSVKKTLNQPVELQIYFNDPNHEGFVFMYNGDGSLKLRLQQINSTGAKSYTFHITHISGGQTKNHTLIINSQKQIQPSRQLMDRTFSLNDIIIEDTEYLNIDTEYNFGTLGMEQIGEGSDLIDKSNPFPTLALGKQGIVNSSDGWSFKSNLSSQKIRDAVKTIYNSSNLSSINMQMYFSDTTASETNTGGRVTLLKKGNPETVIGAFSDAKREKMNTSLKGKITLNLNSLLNEFRNLNRYEVVLESNSAYDEQISYIVGQRKTEGMNNYYYVPSNSDLNSSLVTDKKIEYLNYPKIILKKTHIEENLTLNITKDFNIDNSIIFIDSGINSIPGVSLDSTNTRNLKGLHFASVFKLKAGLNESGPINVNEAGTSNLQSEVIINNDSNELKISIQYKNGYPEIKILDVAKAGIYNLNIIHYEPSTLERINYTLNINLEDPIVSTKEFEVISSIRDIIIRKENDGFVVEYPENWIDMTQFSKDSTLFPVISLNFKDKWEMTTIHSFNPIEGRPWASFIIDERLKTIRKIPVNLKETPYQNTEKFFIYNIGELGNRNIAVGGYTKKLDEGDKNKVKTTFKIDFSQKDLDDIWRYAQTKSEAKVLIPYSSIEDEIHKIYAIKGERDINGFKINSANILEEIAFPKVYVLKGEEIKENIVTATFKNPVPKSDLNLKGSFDINSDGLKLPNDMSYTLEHPESLNISGVTSEWQGYSKINEYHKIDVKVLRDGVTNFIKTITTNNDGTLKDNIQIQNGEKYSYVLKKGKNSLVAIGLESWDLNRTIQYEEILILEHKNSSGRVTHRDKYRVIIQPFNILTYLALPNPIPPDKKLVKSIETGTQRVPLIDFQLKNYDKEITKSTSDSIGVKISINDQEIQLSSNDWNPRVIKGKLSFGGDKSSLQNPNELGKLVFTVTSGIIEASKTYSYKGAIPLVTIKTSNLTENIIEWFEITGTPIDTNLTLPNFTAISNLKEIIINDSKSIPVDPSMGKVSLKQESLPFQSDGTHAFPAIAVGNREALGWEVEGEPFDDSTVRQKAYTKYSFENDPNNEIFTFRTFIGEIYTMTTNTKAYKKVDGNSKIVIIGSHLSSTLEKVESEIYLTLTENILDKARQISGNRVVLRANPNDNNNKIALIHSKRVGNNNGSGDKFYLPTDNINVPVDSRVGYFNYKDIIIEKDSFTKNLALNFLKTYVNNTKIVLKKDSITIPEGVENTIYEEGVLYGINFKNKIKISSSDGTIFSGMTEYETDSLGNIAPIEIKMTKNGAEATLNISYNTLNASLSLKDIKGQEAFNISLEHIEASGDTRRKYNIALKTNSEDKDSYKEGEIDLVISSRYNSFGGRGILLKDGEITYPKEVLDLNLIKGDFPYKPNQSVENIFLETHEGEFQLIDMLRKILTNGTQIDITKYKNEDIFINPFYWRDNNQSDSFNLIYKNSNNEILEKYKFNIKTPNFFVASSGALNFGKIYKIGNPKDVIGEADIELYYNDGNIRATYSLDIDKGIPENGTLYLDDSNNLLIKKFVLGEEYIDSSDSRKRNIKLTGIIDGESIKNTPPGQYEKTLQLLIHIQ